MTIETKTTIERVAWDTLPKQTRFGVPKNPKYDEIISVLISTEDTEYGVCINPLIPAGTENPRKFFQKVRSVFSHRYKDLAVQQCIVEDKIWARVVKKVRSVEKEKKVKDIKAA